MSIPMSLVRKIRRAAQAHEDPEDRLMAVLDLELTSKEREAVEQVGLMVLDRVMRTNGRSLVAHPQRLPFYTDDEEPLL